MSNTGEELVGLSCRGAWQHIAAKNMPQQIKTVPLANFGIIATYRNMLDCSMTLEQATVHEEATPHERSWVQLMAWSQSCGISTINTPMYANVICFTDGACLQVVECILFLCCVCINNFDLGTEVTRLRSLQSMPTEPVLLEKPRLLPARDNSIFFDLLISLLCSQKCRTIEPASAWSLSTALAVCSTFFTFGHLRWLVCKVLESGLFQAGLWACLLVARHCFRAAMGGVGFEKAIFYKIQHTGIFVSRKLI